MYNTHDYVQTIAAWPNMRRCISKRIKAKRLLAGLSRVDLGNKTYIHCEDIKAYETALRDAPMEHLYRIAAATGVSVHSILPETPCENCN
jgi:transcriptional regulator with XRE-family HTH domain